MLKIKLRRFAQVFQFGWKDAKEISQIEGVRKSHIWFFFDIFRCFRKYYLTGYQYKKNQLWKLSRDEKRQLAIKLGDENRFKDAWLDKYYRNWKFIKKYSGVEWETSQSKRTKRNAAYSKFYGYGKNCWTQRDVTFIFEHYSIGSLNVGCDCVFARGCDIDITGDLIIGDHVKMSEGVKILTHNHNLDSKDLQLTPLTICDDVGIGARVIILPGVKKIGRGAILSAGSVIKHEVPPYAIVIGNPAKVVGFRFTPEQIIEYEEDHYPEGDRLNEAELESNYRKYYIDRISDISIFLR